MTPTQRWLVRILAVLAAILLTAGLAPLAADRTLDRVGLRLGPSAPGGSTWLLVGSDSRSFVSEPGDRQAFGDRSVAPGARADIVLLARVPETGQAEVVAVPRDLVVRTADRGARRVASLLADGPQGLVDGICAGLGVPVSHVVIIRFDGFRAVVDAADGVDVTIDAPIRDQVTGLSIPRAGRVHLDGPTALAWVRSRTAEIRVDGAWVPLDATGDPRADRARIVLEEVSGRVGPRHPLRAARALLAATDAVTVDRSTHLLDLLGLARRVDGAERSVTVPVRTRPGRVPVALLAGGARAVLDPLRAPPCR